ncbi:hypothetical protein LTR95_014760 [Oleoguttula sp. CCFEE 5521]
MTLDLFTTLPRCSLSMNELQRFTTVDGPAPWLSRLQYLSLSVSLTNSVWTDLRKEGSDNSEPVPENQTSAHEDAKSLLSFLRATPNLVSLNMKFYDAHNNSWRSRLFTSTTLYWFNLVAVHVQLPQLSTLTLRHFRASSRTLRGFLTRHPLRVLTLEQIRFQPAGRLTTVLNSISGPKRKVKLERLVVADVLEDSWMDFETSGVLGDGEGIPDFVFIGEHDQLDKTVETFRWGSRSGRSSSNVHPFTWDQYHMMHFGPPHVEPGRW